MVQATPALAVEVASCSIATITWDGGGDTTDWSTDANWNPTASPVPPTTCASPPAAPQSDRSVLGASATVLSVEATKPVAVNGALEVTSTTQASSLVGEHRGGHPPRCGGEVVGW